MNIDINLNFQSNKVRSKKTLRVFSAVTLLLAILTVTVLLFDLASSKLLLWFYMFYFLVISISLFIQSKGKHVFDLIGKSFLKMDEEIIEFKPQMLGKKLIQIHWREIEEVNLKLFEVQLLVNGEWLSINLEKLSDDNLKLVKNAFGEFQKHLDEKKSQVAVTA